MLPLDLMVLTYFLSDFKLKEARHIKSMSRTFYELCVLD